MNGTTTCLSKIPKLKLITKLDCTPCKGAKFVLQKLKQTYNFEAEIIYLNAANKQEIYEEYKLDNSKIPSIFIGDKLIAYGKIVESEIKNELDNYIKI